MVALAVCVAGTAIATADPASVWTLQGENAALSSSKVVDRFYTNGLRLGYVSPEGAVSAGPAGALLGPGAQRWSFDLTQQIFTPYDTTVPAPPPGDRPYAGVLLGTFGLTADSDGHRTSLSLGLGLVGPGALAAETQNRFHGVIGQRGLAGWHSQLRDEPLLQFSGSRVWRLPIGRMGGLEADALPEVAAGAGNLRVYAASGVTLRVGQGLGGDFGAPRLVPAASCGDAFAADNGFAWYLFAGIDGQAVAHDLTLDGNSLVASRHASRIPLIGEADAGFGLRFRGVRLTYSHVIQTEQFHGQKGGAHQLGSLALSMRF